MEKEQFQAIITTITAVWGTEFDPAKVTIWGKYLGDLEYKATCLAIDELAQTSKYPPTIALIRERVVFLENEQLSEMQAWEKTEQVLFSRGSEKFEELTSELKNDYPLVYETISELGTFNLGLMDVLSAQSAFSRKYKSKVINNNAKNNLRKTTRDALECKKKINSRTLLEGEG